MSQLSLTGKYTISVVDGNTSEVREHYEIKNSLTKYGQQFGLLNFFIEPYEFDSFYPVPVGDYSIGVGKGEDFTHTDAGRTVYLPRPTDFGLVNDSRIPSITDDWLYGKSVIVKGISKLDETAEIRFPKVGGVPTQNHKLVNPDGSMFIKSYYDRELSDYFKDVNNRDIRKRNVLGAVFEPIANPMPFNCIVVGAKARNSIYKQGGNINGDISAFIPLSRTLIRNSENVPITITPRSIDYIAIQWEMELACKRINQRITSVFNGTTYTGTLQSWGATNCTWSMFSGVGFRYAYEGRKLEEVSPNTYLTTQLSTNITEYDYINQTFLVTLSTPVNLSEAVITKFRSLCFTIAGLRYTIEYDTEISIPAGWSFIVTLKMKW